MARKLDNFDIVDMIRDCNREPKGIDFCNFIRSEYGNIDIDDFVVKKKSESRDEINALLEKCDEGFNDNSSKRTQFMNVKFFQSPVRVPSWCFRHFDIDILNLETDLLKVALAHVIYFTQASCHTGYIAMSCNIENWTFATPDEVDMALLELEHRNFITSFELDEEDCFGHSRNKGYIANIEFLHELLSLYHCEVWA